MDRVTSGDRAFDNSGQIAVPVAAILPAVRMMRKGHCVAVGKAHFQKWPLDDFFTLPKKRWRGGPRLPRRLWRYVR